jgi:hypothetical protein
MARMATSFSIWQRIRAVNMHEGAVFEGPPTPPPEKSKPTVEDTVSAQSISVCFFALLLPV